MSNSALLLTYRRNSLPRDSPQMHRILAAIKESSIFVVLGYSERAAKTCYIAQSFISPAGEIVHHHRKIKLTGVERNIWGEGGAESITTVVPTPFGRVGALCCAEHYQPLLRFYEYAQGVQIHVASWPMTFEFSRLKDPVEGHEGFNGDLAASQFMAGEGKCFVLVATQVLTEKSFETLNIREGVEVTRKAVVSSRVEYPGGGVCFLSPNMSADVELYRRAAATR
jgi:nitrilase